MNVRQVLCPSCSHRNHQHRPTRRAHVEPQHTLLGRSRTRHPHRHGEVRQGTRPQRLLREDRRPRHFLHWHPTQEGSRHEGILHRGKEHRGRQAPCPCHRQAHQQPSRPRRHPQGCSRHPRHLFHHEARRHHRRRHHYPIRRHRQQPIRWREYRRRRRVMP